MRYLFVDNYRGFESTFIPIKDVNFLVGENSTGKSSILSLINLLGSPNFWFTQEFNNDQVELGVFKDIVSAASDNKSFFKVGAVECDDKATFPTERQRVFLMTFVEEKGLPTLKEFNFVVYDKQIQVVFLKSQVKFKIVDITPLKDIASTLLETFKGWLTRIDSNRGFKILKYKEIAIGRRGVLPIIRTAIKQIELRESESEQELDFGSLFELDIPTFADQLAWIAPVRSKPKRVYGAYRREFTPEGDHTPHLIKDLLSRESSSKPFKEFIEKFGGESGLFEDIYVKNFGRSFAAPFELGVTIDGNPLRISDIGYGVSQSLPIIVELFARTQGQWFAFQQPEVHLHPKAQAALGVLFMDLTIQANKRFFIETHSDFIVDRFRTCYRDNEAAKKIDSQVLFFERYEHGNRIHNIPILKDGNYIDNQPAGFRDFFINEELRVLGL